MKQTDSPLFELASYKDLFQKAKYDLAQLDGLVNSYDLFNYLCTINHLYEWVKEETGVTPPSRKDSGTLETIRQLCNRAKHFKKGDAPDTIAIRAPGMGRPGIGLPGIGEPSYTVMIEGSEVWILELCKDAFVIWERFLKENNLLER